MAVTRWGIIGPGDIAHNFADGLKETDAGKLTAIASRDAGRRKAFGDQYGIAESKRHSTYEALAADPDIDAIYVSTPHPWHAELSIMAMRHGKAVVCEKPMGMHAGEAAAVTEAAAQAGVFFMEAFMYRCHPQIARLVEIIKSGEIGQVRHIKATFGFSSQRNPASRLYDPLLGGGGILDVGCYPVSASRLIAGAAIGAGFDNPVTVKGVAVMGPTGVDETAYGLLTFKSGITAEIACSVQNEMENAVIAIGDKGTIRLGNPWVPGRNAGPSDATIEVTVGGKSRVEEIKSHHHLFAFGRSCQPPDRRRQNAGRLPGHEPWRLGRQRRHARPLAAEVGYVTFPARPKNNRALTGITLALPSIPKIKLDGVKLPVSRLPAAQKKKNGAGANTPLLGGRKGAPAPGGGPGPRQAPPRGAKRKKNKQTPPPPPPPGRPPHPPLPSPPPHPPPNTRNARRGVPPAETPARWGGKSGVFGAPPSGGGRGKRGHPQKKKKREGPLPQKPPPPPKKKSPSGGGPPPPKNPKIGPPPPKKNKPPRSSAPGRPLFPPPRTGGPPPPPHPPPNPPPPPPPSPPPPPPPKPQKKKTPTPPKNPPPLGPPPKLPPLPPHPAAIPPRDFSAMPGVGRGAKGG